MYGNHSPFLVLVPLERRWRICPVRPRCRKAPSTISKTSTARVLRLRAASIVLRDKSVSLCDTRLDVRDSANTTWGAKPHKPVGIRWKSEKTLIFSLSTHHRSISIHHRSLSNSPQKPLQLTTKASPTHHKSISNSQQNRHPERSASQICRETES